MHFKTTEEQFKINKLQFKKDDLHFKKTEMQIEMQIALGTVNWFSTKNT